jgi:hypothetical protein
VPCQPGNVSFVMLCPTFDYKLYGGAMRSTQGCNEKGRPDGTPI